MRDETIDLYIDADPSDEAVLQGLCNQLRAAGFKGQLRRRADVLAGSDFAATVEHWIRTARVVALLWSADALASDHGRRALDLAHEREPTTVFPILARPCDGPRGSFGDLLPEDGKALSEHAVRDGALQQIARRLLSHLIMPEGGDWRVADANEPQQAIRTIPCAGKTDVESSLLSLVDALSDRADEHWPGADDEDDDDLPNHRRYRSPWDIPERCSKLSERRIIARGEEELRVKRARVAALRARPDPIRGWDGRPLDGDALAPWKFGFSAAEGIPHIHDNEVLAAFYGLATAPEKLRGVVILGAPGSGKSLLSRVAERRFLAGPLSALGFAVRRSARDLAAIAAENRDASILQLLKLSGGDARLLDELVSQRRLFLIVDGLDEVSARARRHLGALLAKGDTPFLATSREIPGGLDVLPPHAKLQIEPWRREDALRALRAWERPDLAKMLESRLPYSDYERKEKDAMAALCRTPFHLALLCKAVRRDEAIRPEGESDLYRRVFDGLLDQAVEDRRLHEEQADVLRRQGHVLAGNLAITWLRSEAGRLTDVEVSSALESAGLSGKDVIEIQRAFEFGYLLAPGADNFEFSHRTIAEWVAARAIAHRVRVAARRATQSGRSLLPAEMAEIEQRELGPFLEAKERDVRPSAWPLLRFYMPEAVAPVEVVRRLLGPQVCGRDGFNVVEQSFEAAFELASLARWTDAESARAAWGLFVRAATFTAHDQAHEAPLLSREPPEQVTAFAQGVADHLPKSLAALVSIAARTEGQAHRLTGDPTAMVRFCPKGHLGLFEDLLRQGTAKQKRLIVEQYVTQTEELPYEVERRWPTELPGQIGEALDPGDRHVLEQVEQAVYEGLVGSSREVPWNALWRRLLDWPHHLHQVLTRWFCAPERQESRFGFGHDAPSATAVRTQALSMLLVELTTAHGVLLRGLRDAASDPNVSRLRGDLKWQLERDEGDNPWPRFEAMTRVAGWPLERSFDFSRDERHPRCGPLSSAFTAYDERQRQIDGVLKALREAGRLDAVAGPLWGLLAPEQEPRRLLFERFLGAASVPTSVPVEAILQHFGETDLLPYEMTSGTMLTRAHEQRLRELARSGHGHQRFLALLWCARRDEKDQTDELVAHLAEGDAEFLRLARRYVESRGHRPSAKAGLTMTPEALATAPLAYRAQNDAPGWRDELVCALEAATPPQEHELLALVRRHHVREALPVLEQRFRAIPSNHLAKAIASIVSPEDREAIELLLSTDAPQVGIPKRVMSMLSMADLPRVLSRRDPPSSGFPWRPTSDGLERFGSDARALFLDAFRARKKASQEKAREERRIGIDGDAAWTDMLRRALLQTVEPATTPMETIVALLQELFHGDRHDVYSSPGPLGSDFDEPHDLVYESKLQHSSELGLAIQIVKGRLDLRADEDTVAARLLDHPSETLQLGVFEALASRTEPHRIASLAIRALEGHLRATDTKFEGETTGVLLASTTRGGSGSIHIHQPEVGRKLAEAVRGHLTTAHQTMLGDLVSHARPGIRRLACRWIGELGTAGWAPLLTTALGDGSAGVAMAALRSWIALDLSSLAPALAAASRRRWSARHYQLVLEWLAFRPPRYAVDFDPPTPRRADEVLPIGLAAKLVGEALEILPIYEEPPEALETLLTTLGEGPHTEEGCVLSSPSLRARSEHAGTELRAVLLRTLARRGGEALPDDAVTRLSAASPEERLGAAESLALAGRADLAPQIIAVWNDAFLEPAWSAAPALRLRLGRMLEEAPSELSPLWLHLLDDLRFDMEGSLDVEGEELLQISAHCLRRWGLKGLDALLDTIPSDPERWKPDGEACRSLADAFGVAEVRRTLRGRVDLDPAFAELANGLHEDREERSGRVEQFLASEVLPEGWWT